MRKTVSIQQDLVHVAIALNILRLSVGMSGVFIPLIILKRGAPLWSVAAFYVMYACIKLIINYPVTRLIQKWGAHIGLGIGFCAAGLQLLFILGFSWTGIYWLLPLGAMSLAIANAFVWNSQHIHISKVMDSSTKSSTIASIEIVGQSLDIIAPLIGGTIGFFFGPIGLVGVSLLCLLASILPLRKMNALKTENAHIALKYSLKGAPKRDTFANFCFNIETSIGVMLWPIYLAVVLKTFSAIGSITAIAAVATIVTVWIAGHRGDAGKDRQVLLQGATISSISHIMRLFAATTFSIAAVSVIYKASLAYLQNAWVSSYYTNAKQQGLQYIMSMEIACDLAYLILWGCLLIVLLVSSNASLFFGLAFIIAALAAWGCLFISKRGMLDGPTQE